MQRGAALPTIKVVIRADGEGGAHVRAVARKQLPLRPAGPGHRRRAARLVRRASGAICRGGRRGGGADPYRVWLSRDHAAADDRQGGHPLLRAFRRALADGRRRWPRPQLDDVLAMWAGLGYYSRARNLHGARVAVAARPDGQFPRTEAELAASCRASGPTRRRPSPRSPSAQPATPVDGNIERVVSRLFAVKQPLPAAKREIQRLAATLTPAKRAGDFAQAMMDLGATRLHAEAAVVPDVPAAAGLRRACARASQSTLPRKAAKAERPVRYGIAFLALREDGAVLLRKRPEAGLLGGMLEVPSTDWADDAAAGRSGAAGAPVRGDWWSVPGVVSHTFTHFRLELMVYRAIVPVETRADVLGRAASAAVGCPAATSTSRRCRRVMRKIIAHALKEQ